MNEEPQQEANQRPTPVDYSSLVFRASTAVSLLFFKATLILNSGALVAILIAITRSEDRAISSLLIGATTYFGIGLTSAVVGLLFYSTTYDLKEEMREKFGTNKWSLFICLLSILLSFSVFLYGTWDIIGSLSEELAVTDSPQNEKQS